MHVSFEGCTTELGCRAGWLAVAGWPGVQAGLDISIASLQILVKLAMEMSNPATPQLPTNQPCMQPKAQWCNPQKSRASGDLIYAHNYEHQSNPLLTTLKAGKVKLHSVSSHALPLPGWKKDRREMGGGGSIK